MEEEKRGGAAAWYLQQGGRRAKEERNANGLLQVGARESWERNQLFTARSGRCWPSDRSSWVKRNFLLHFFLYVFSVHFRNLNFFSV
jgi:hypothetical protein